MKDVDYIESHTGSLTNGQLSMYQTTRLLRITDEKMATEAAAAILIGLLFNRSLITEKQIRDVIATTHTTPLKPSLR